MVRQAGVDLPTFCYHSELSVYGACRMCVVEDGRGATCSSSCSTPPADGMDDQDQHAARCQHIRKMMLELLLANHDRDCTTCVEERPVQAAGTVHALRRGPGALPGAGALEVQTGPLDAEPRARPRTSASCAATACACARRSRASARSTSPTAAPKCQVHAGLRQGLGEVNCVNCGQCVAVCPTGALSVRSEIEQVWARCATRRSAWSSRWPRPCASPSARSSASSRARSHRPDGRRDQRLGFDQVFDTTFTADLTTSRRRASSSAGWLKRRAPAAVHLLLPGLGQVRRAVLPREARRSSRPAARRSDVRLGRSRSTTPKQHGLEPAGPLRRLDHALHGQEVRGPAARVRHGRRRATWTPC